MVMDFWEVLQQRPSDFGLHIPSPELEQLRLNQGPLCLA